MGCFCYGSKKWRVRPKVGYKLTIADSIQDLSVYVIGMLFCYLPIYVFGLMLLKRQVGNPEEAQKSAIYGVAQKFNNRELMCVIEHIINKENPRILMPTKTSWMLHIVSALFFVTVLYTMFFDLLIKLIPFNLEKIVLFTLSGVFFVLGFFLIYLESRYLIDLKRLKEEYTKIKSGNVRVVVD